MDGTTKYSGIALAVFLLGFAILGTAAVGGGLMSLIGGGALLVVSAVVFKSARIKEGV